MSFRIIDHKDVVKLIKKHKIAATMVSESIKRENFAWRQFRGIGYETQQIMNRNTELRLLSDVYIDKIKRLESEIEELRNEKELLNFKITHLESNVDVHEKI